MVQGMTQFVADDAELIFGVVEANVPSQHVALVSGVSSLFAIGAREGSCPDATGRGVACSLTMATVVGVRHRPGSMEIGNMVGNGGGWELIDVDGVSLRSLFDFGSVEIGVRIAVRWFFVAGFEGWFHQNGDGSGRVGNGRWNW